MVEYTMVTRSEFRGTWDSVSVPVVTLIVVELRFSEE